MLQALIISFYTLANCARHLFIMKCPHTEFRKGQKILIIFRNGDRFVDKYKSKKSGVIITEALGRSELKRIRSVVIVSRS